MLRPYSCFAFLFTLSAAIADGNSFTVNAVNESGVGAVLGTVSAVDSPYGVLLTPNLAGLPPGLHGFHLHENPSCQAGDKDGKKVPALAAGGHWDPAKSGAHLGPYANGHMGDLPALYVDAQGQATVTVLAPRLKLKDLPGHALMIHVHGDNFADQPEKLGGGGPRMACAVL